MSTSVFTWLLASCVTTFIPAARACVKTSSSASGEFGTTVIALGFPAISFRMMSTCFCGSASSAPVMVASTPFCAANCLIPSSMRSNHPIPVRLTTVTILTFFVFGSFWSPGPDEARGANTATTRMDARPATTTRFEFRITATMSQFSSGLQDTRAREYAHDLEVRTTPDCRPSVRIQGADRVREADATGGDEDRQETGGQQQRAGNRV